MNNALLIGYFPKDPLLQEFYHLLAAQIRDFDFALTGIELGGNTFEEYEFPIVSFGVPKQGMLAKVQTKLERVLARWLTFNPQLLCYAQIQAKGTERRAVMAEMNLLRHFQKQLERYIREEGVKLVILNHQFSGHHLIARDVCVRLEIPCFYWHPGFLPGTMTFDRRGQLAESEINERLTVEFEHSGADEEHLGEAYRQWAREGGYVRPGKKSESNADCLRAIEALTKKFDKVVLVVGSVDYRSGLQPESYPNAKMHSAVIRSSDTLFEKVVQCTDDSTLVVYKPHPNTAPNASGLEIISKKSCRIFDVTMKDLLLLVDASVTICSMAAFEALILGVPTVIVGNLPGSNLGICYKPDDKNFDLKKVLTATLEGGITPAMEKRLNLLMGYLIKNYFFASGSGACPLVQRSLKTALSEMLTEENAVVPGVTVLKSPRTGTNPAAPVQTSSHP